ncbi:MAG: YceI family protein [Flavobacterium sp.]|nr:YceI family protein [Flavobacterium sp.]
MYKKSILFLLFTLSSFCFAQDKVISKTGNITFEASVPALEEVKALNNGVTFVINTKTGEIASLALMKGFRFKVALMEEHFNENYVESDTFPKATFRGKIDGFDFSALTESAKEYTITGKLELHGKSNDISIKAKIKKSDSGITILSNFFVNASDYNISIPSVVKSKVSNKISVKFDATLK